MQRLVASCVCMRFFGIIYCPPFFFYFFFSLFSMRAYLLAKRDAERAGAGAGMEVEVVFISYDLFMHIFDFAFAFLYDCIGLFACLFICVCLFAVNGNELRFLFINRCMIYG